MATIETSNASMLDCIIREIVSENLGIDHLAATDILIDSLAGDDDAVRDALETVRPALVTHVSALRRNKARRAERKIWRKPDPNKEKPGEAREALIQKIEEDMAAYADEYVDIPSRGLVRAGEVTIPEWNERIGSIQDGIARDQETVNLYVDFVDRLENSDAENIDAYLAS